MNCMYNEGAEIKGTYQDVTKSPEKAFFTIDGQVPVKNCEIKEAQKHEDQKIKIIENVEVSLSPTVKMDNTIKENLK